MSTRESNYTATAVKEEKKEDVFEIVNNKYERFNESVSSKFIKSSDLCKTANRIFENVYDDYEGSTLEVVGNNIYLCLWFNHAVKMTSSDKKPITAFTQYMDSSNCRNELINTIKNRDRRSREGNRYHITKYGMEGLEKFMRDYPVDCNIRKRNGEVIWDKCYTDIADGAQYSNGFQAQKVCTKLSYIDPIKVLEFAHGKYVKVGRDRETGNDIKERVFYTININQVLNSPIGMRNNSGTTEYLLKIDRLNDVKMKNTSADLGLGNYSSLGIVK